MHSVPASSQVVTVRSAEGVELELPIAGPAPRMAAYMIDVVLVIGMLLVLMLLTALAAPIGAWISDHADGFGRDAFHGDNNAMASLAPLLVALTVAIYFGEFVYFSVWELATRGLTPGKYLLGLRVVGSNGQPLDAKAVILRNALRVVDILPSGYTIGLVTMIGSRYGQRLGDHAAGTIVIRTDKIEAPAPLDLPADIEPLALSREQLSRIGERELTLIRSTLRRIHGAEAANMQNAALLEQIAHVLVERLGLDLEEASSPERLLQRVLVTAQRKLKA
jgi:uncharacterized RDD family membrane protein YckC